MSIKFLIDMNLPPELADLLVAAGWSALHWSRVGNMRAKDEEIFAWAGAHDQVIITCDLDFSAILAATQADSPSVILLRLVNPDMAHLLKLLQPLLNRHEPELHEGAILVVDEKRVRVRILPLKRR